jgi:hyperosmotically inducible periplasmic protein
MRRNEHILTAAALSCTLAASGAFAAEAASNQPVKDSFITAQVKTELTKDRATTGRNIMVATEHGIVSLSGTVASPAERQKAEQDARGIKGVTDVRNELTVKPE